MEGLKKEEMDKMSMVELKAYAEFYWNSYNRVDAVIKYRSL